MRVLTASFDLLEQFCGQDFSIHSCSCLHHLSIRLLGLRHRFDLSALCRGCWLVWFHWKF